MSTSASKKMIFGSMAIAGVVALVAILDMATELPYGRQIGLDVAFLISAAMVIYLAWDSYRELR